MSHDPRDTDDKFENHYRQQLSALVDGELAPDEARFLLRRLQHDAELSGRFERWQLCGDVLRGQVGRVVAADFSARVAAAIAAPASAETLQPLAAAGGRRLALTRWSGGAALAASVAAVAMLVGRQGAPDPAGVPAPALAVQTLPSTDAVLAAASAPAPVAAPATAAPAAPQVARTAARPRVQREPLGDMALASASAGSRAPAQAAAAAPVFVALADTEAALPVLSPADPFASSAPLQARPWPRAVLPQPSGNGYIANFGGQGQTRAFYPFEPSLPVPAQPLAPDGGERGDLPAPPDDGQR